MISSALALFCHKTLKRKFLSFMAGAVDNDSIHVNKKYLKLTYIAIL